MKKTAMLDRIPLFILFIQNGYAQQSDFPFLTGAYLGQKPPGMTPEAQVIWRGRTNHHGPDESSAP